MHALQALEGSTQRKPVKLQQVLEAAPASRKFLSMVMTNLGHAGIIHSTRGHHGGYWLDRPLAEISLLDLVDALAPSTSADPDPDAGATHRSLDGVWAEVDAQARSLLSGVTIDQLAAGSDPRPAPGHPSLAAERRAPSA